MDESYEKLLCSPVKKTLPVSSPRGAGETSSDRFIPYRQDESVLNLIPRDIYPRDGRFHHDSNPHRPYLQALAEGLCNNAPSSLSSPSSLAALQFRAPVEKRNSPNVSPVREAANGFQSRSRPFSGINRSISNSPFRILSANDITDDFYLNLLDWSSKNVVAIGLQNKVYMWNASNERLSSLPFDISANNLLVCSVSWSPDGNHIAVGFLNGATELWDAEVGSLLVKYMGHSQRVGVLAWNNNILTSGSRDKLIVNQDIREAAMSSKTFNGHLQEVCGLKWSTFGNDILASGGNDNSVILWDLSMNKSYTKLDDHNAAIKALAWSPHQRNILATGGGTADRTIRVWNTSICEPVIKLDTGSQVCNLAWSKNSNEILSTHGFSRNQIVVWDFPSMTQQALLTGHTTRVLYLATSPDGSAVVTGAGDKTIRFWNVFPRPKELVDNFRLEIR